MINKEALEVCNEAIKQSKKSIITTHVNPDGDAIGSVLALSQALKFLGKEVEIIIDSTVPHFLLFLEGAGKILAYNSKLHDKLINNADTIFFLDLNHSKRVRTMESVCLQSRARLVMIDHHVAPQDFCHLCIVDTHASSTGELVWRLIDLLDIEITKDIAEALYVAILTDTGSFRFEKTTGELHRIIADLIDKGANPFHLYEKVYNQNSFSSTKLLGEAISNMELFYDGRLAVMTVTDEMFRANNTTDDDIEGYVEKTLMIKGVEAGILISEVRRRDEMRVSFRSKGKTNVRDLANRFGGGGHINASGARISGTNFADSRKMLIRAAEMLFSK